MTLSYRPIVEINNFHIWTTDFSVSVAFQFYFSFVSRYSHSFVSFNSMGNSFWQMVQFNQSNFLCLIKCKSLGASLFFFFHISHSFTFACSSSAWFLLISLVRWFELSIWWKVRFLCARHSFSGGFCCWLKMKWTLFFSFVCSIENHLEILWRFR